MRTVFLKPGDHYFSDDPAAVTTVLGSCVSITAFDPLTGTAGITHALLPQCPERDCLCGGEVGSFRFVECSINHLLSRFLLAGIPFARLKVKLFGGADMFGRDGTIMIGRENVEAAIEALRRNSIAVEAHDTGGRCGRKIIFDCTTGDVYVKKLKELPANAFRTLHERSRR